MKKIRDLFKNRINKNLKKVVFYNLLTLIIAISFAFFSVQLIPMNNATDVKFEVYSTLIIIFIIVYIIGEKILEKFLTTVKTNKISALLSLFFSACIIRKAEFTKAYIIYWMIPKDMINIFSHKIYLIATLACYILVTIIFSAILNYLQNLIKEFTKEEKRIIIIISVIGLLAITIVYGFNQNFFLQYDKIYSMDSGWVHSGIYSQLNYYDIRHPLLSIFYFPIWAIVETTINIIFGVSQITTILKTIIFQFINFELLLMIGIYLKKITKNNNVFMLYMVSFPTLLYTLFFEKYQLCVFLIVYYVYLVCLNKHREVIFLSSVGSMPTSGIIGISELFTKEKFKSKIKMIIKIGISCFLLTIFLGRIHIFKYGFDEAINLKDRFSNTSLNIEEKIYSSLNMTQSTLIGLNSEIVNGKYLWKGLTTHFSVIGIVIIVISLIGFYAQRKKLIAKISLLWETFAFVLFIILNWSTHESPLFNLYFSWAFITLFVFGIDFILDKIKIDKKKFYNMLFIMILIINTIFLINIYNFLTTF